MKISNTWIDYVTRDFSSIKSSIFKRLAVEVPELSDKQSSNLFTILVDIFSGVGELLNFYIDNTARELYVPTARNLSSLLKIAYQSGYNGRARVPSYCFIEIQPLNSSGEVIAIPEDVEIPKGTIILDSDNRVWRTVSTVTFRKGYYSATLEAIQGEPISDYLLGVSTETPNMEFLLPQDYADGSSDILVGSEHWNYVEDLGFSRSTSKDYTVLLKGDGNIYAVFGDGVNGQIPQGGVEIYLNYLSTDGGLGNIPSNYITSLSSSIFTPPTVSSYKVVNPSPGFGGKDIEGIEDLRKAIPLSLRTLYRAVTKQDYVDLAVLAPGIRGAILDYSCNLGVNLYVVSEGGGSPSQTLLDSTKSYVESRAIVGMPLKVLPSGEAHIKGEMTVVGRYRITAPTIEKAVKEALLDIYSPYRVRINGSIRLSDIIARIDNLSEVDYLDLNYIYVEPYLRPSNLQVNLVYNIKIHPDTNYTRKWVARFNASDNLLYLYSEGIFKGTAQAGVTKEFDTFDFYYDSVPSNVGDGDTWEFTIYPYNQDVELTDYSIPVIGPEDFVINVKETNG